VRPTDFDFELPPEQIAQQPPAQRSAARMLVVPRDGPLEHRSIAELPDLLARLDPTPLLVINDSKVVPARIHARREGGKRFELLIVDPAALGPGARLDAWIRGAKLLRAGDCLQVEGGELTLRYLGRATGVDSRACTLEIVEGELLGALDRAGELPLPPYIARPEGPSSIDRERYQTVFARERGSVAAPTAGLHFDAELLARLDHVALTLHVGPGTFLPIEAEDVREHRVGAERHAIDETAAMRIEAARASGRPILAVGTTVTRTLESIAAAHGGRIVAGEGTTELVITPGYRFAVVDRLLTNFHLPRSSLLMLACSFAGRERVLGAYAEAVRAGYRFYSYGDCTLLELGAPDSARRAVIGSPKIC
jgi:S-adenosylmethionine:tRNA ribosyltransferase-isomerase